MGSEQGLLVVRNLTTTMLMVTNWIENSLLKTDEEKL